MECTKIKEPCQMIVAWEYELPVWNISPHARPSITRKAFLARFAKTRGLLGHVWYIPKLSTLGVHQIPCLEALDKVNTRNGVAPASTAVNRLQKWPFK